MKLEIDEIKKLIPHRDPFLFVDTCEIIKLDSGTGRQVIALNERLQMLSEQMKDLVANSDHNGHKVAIEKKNVIKGMAKTLEDIGIKRKEINGLRQDIITARASAKAQRQEVDTIAYKYMAWTLAGLTLGIMAVRQIIQAK